MKVISRTLVGVAALVIVVLVLWFILDAQVSDLGTDLPELSTIIAVLSVIAVPVATLIAVAVTQRNHRKTKRIELQHQSELKEKDLRHQSELKEKELRAQERLKSLELQEENRRILRAEKRSIYKDNLRDSRYILHYWDDAGRVYWHPAPGPLDKPLDPNEVVENAKNLRHYHELKEYQAEADSIASDMVVELIGTLADFVRNCEQRVLFEVQANGITDPQTQQILWRNLQAALQQEFREQGVQPAYFALRAQIRKELDAA